MITKEEKKLWVIREVGDMLPENSEDAVYDFFYRAMNDYAMTMGDADRYLWLNTLFGYDIGADHAMGLITWFDDCGMDVLELGEDGDEIVRNACKDLGYHLTFTNWAMKKPTKMLYGLSYVPAINVGILSKRY